MIRSGKRYQLDGGPWQRFPERINAQAVIYGGPGNYLIRAEKPGYAPQETVLTINETAEGSCQVAAETISLPMSLAVCPATEPALLDVEIEPAGSDLQVTAFASQGGTQAVTCAQEHTENCAHYRVPLNNFASYTVEIKGLDGIGPLFVENGVISYTLRTSQITLRQNSIRQGLAVTGANSLSATFSVTPDEVGCPLADFRTLETRPEPDRSADAPFPALAVAQLNSLLITDLDAPGCELLPEPYPVTFAATIPAGTPLAEVSLLYFLDDEWQNGDCEVTDGRLLCTAVYPNPLLAQPYAYKIVAAEEEYIGTSLPFDNVCIIFGN